MCPARGVWLVEGLWLDEDWCGVWLVEDWCGWSTPWCDRHTCTMVKLTHTMHTTPREICEAQVSRGKSMQWLASLPRTVHTLEGLYGVRLVEGWCGVWLDEDWCGVWPVGFPETSKANTTADCFCFCWHNVVRAPTSSTVNVRSSGSGSFSWIQSRLL